MPESEVLALCLTAATLGLVHTLLGPDHYVPFVAMAKVGRWLMRKTMIVTALCGVGHVAGSIMIGALGIAIGWGLGGLEAFEAGRGSLAGWLLLGFGMAYAAWGLHRAVRKRTGGHLHVQTNGATTYHHHDHDGEHRHETGHDREDRYAARGTMTPWVLFTIFVFGPCEPLIPVLMYPAAKQSAWSIALVSLVFAIFTIGTMLTVVTLGVTGLAHVQIRGLARYGHVVAGMTIAACGAAVTLGL